MPSATPPPLPKTWPGFLVVLEGVDGSGKTTLAEGMAAALKARGYRVVRTREPTDGPYGRRIRELARTGRGAVTAEEEFELFHLDRTEHVATVVMPALLDGTVVIQDRSYFSSVAYQGERGLDRTDLLERSERVAPRPDLLLIVDIPAETAVARIRESRGTETDDFEAVEALRRVRAAFLELDGAVCIDGRDAPDVVLTRALGTLLPAVEQKLGPAASGPYDGA